MLSESTIRKECNKLGLSTDGNKPQLIRWAVCLRIGVGLQRAPITFVLKYRVLGARIRDQERKMITMGNVTGHVSHDVTPIHKVLSAELIIKLSIVKDHSKVDAEDLPSNMEGMEREELQCVAASYGVDFDDKADVKVLGHITHITLLKDD